MNHGAVVRELKVESRRFFGGRFVMQFAGIPDRTEAEKIRGMELAVPEEEIGSLPENQFFVHDLVGMIGSFDGRTDIGHGKERDARPAESICWRSGNGVRF